MISDRISKFFSSLCHHYLEVPPGGLIIIRIEGRKKNKAGVDREKKKNALRMPGLGPSVCTLGLCSGAELLLEHWLAKAGRGNCVPPFSPVFLSVSHSKG